MFEHNFLDYFGLLSNKMTERDYPIDIVYLWCDDTDKQWQTKKQQYLSNEKHLDSQSTSDCRFANNDELKYSLRSVAKYAPWINHIYIVSDHQTPSWLNTDHPKITMINHEDILPKENLPLFNSCAIETGVAKIIPLSEHFLLANDDTFLGAFVHPKDFFNSQGQAIVYLKPNPAKKKIAKSQYSQFISQMQNTIFKAFGKRFNWQPHHNIDAYLKSEYQKCINHFHELSATTIKHRFRKAPCFHRSLIGYYMICRQKAVQHNIKKWRFKLLKLFPLLKHFIQVDSVSFNTSALKNIKKISSISPKMFCLNDCEKTTAKDRQQLKQFMQELFPTKSEFEK